MSSSIKDIPTAEGTTTREKASLRSRTQRVLDLADEVSALSPEALLERAASLREVLSEAPSGAARVDAQVEAFALSREAAARALGQTAFPVQVLGGLVIADGGIAEMATGEGKTLTAVAPVAWWAFFSNGVHVATANDYLASRDAALLAPVYALLGLSVGVADRSESLAKRKAAYSADITYGTAQTFGFDYLTDNLATSGDEVVQGPHFAAVVDEADSLLIDEARTPLIISAPDPRQKVDWKPYVVLAGTMKRDKDYEAYESEEFIALTDAGMDAAERFFGVDRLFDHPVTVQRILTALRAESLLLRDRNYVVTGGQVVIVDENTGRTMADRRFQDGLHEALEAKEGLESATPSVTMATTTLQSYFGMYDHLGGMTGTAATDAEELTSTYGTPVVIVPTHRPRIRQDLEDLLFSSSSDKFEALAKDVMERSAKGQPVLVGTPSVEESERVSAHLRSLGVDHQVLNAKHHAREAHIIAQAGRKGNVTVSTNMAGRGVDIKLGGDPHELAVMEVGPEAVGTGAYHEALARFEEATREERDAVIASGGLAVLATSRHTSRRVDNQLRGRSGRQGEPGLTQFYLAADDEIVRIFGGDQASKLLGSIGSAGSGPISHPVLSRLLSKSQGKIEGLHADARRSLVEFDGVYTAQRRAFYSLRKDLLEMEVNGFSQDFLVKAFKSALSSRLKDRRPKSLSAEELTQELSGLVPGDVPEAARTRSLDEAAKVLADTFRGDLHARLAPLDVTGDAADGNKAAVIRKILLDVIDQFWARHLTRMDSVQNAVSLRRFAQVDPKIAFAQEAMGLYQSFIDAFYGGVLNAFWRLSLTLSTTPEVPGGPSLDEASFESSEETPSLEPSDLAAQASEADEER
jgi:preprotein translocase subunit SecA